MLKVGIIGSGAWGTALAFMLNRAGHDVRMYVRNPRTLQHIHQHQAHPLFPHHPWPVRAHISDDPGLCADSEILFSVIPVQVTPQTLASLPLSPHVPLVLCSKGLYQPEGQLLSEAIRAAGCPQPWAILSGPSFAEEVIQGCLTSVVVATETPDLIDQLRPVFTDPSFKVIDSHDAIGVQLAGALKNVLAIMSGMVLAGGLGENTRAALIGYAFQELMELGQALGAHSETFYGLAGLGDIFLSATSTRSRNFCLGQRLAGASGQGSQALAEGRYTATALRALIHKTGLSLPVLTTISQVIQAPHTLSEKLHHLWAQDS